MYKPTYNSKKNRIPILSKDKMDAIAENYIRDFSPEAMKEPMAIDIDLFVEDYLDLKLDFQNLSHNGVYLGMTVFNDTNKVPVYDPKTNTAEYIHADARTVIIDNSLLEYSQEHRYRFTMGHESGHDIFHAPYFLRNFSQCQPMIQCRTVALEDKTNSLKVWDDNSWMEWQANYMSAALLMPKSMVLKLIDSRKNIPSSFRDVMFVDMTSRVFNVSYEAARYRLEGLGIIDNMNKVG